MAFELAVVQIAVAHDARQDAVYGGIFGEFAAQPHQVGVEVAIDLDECLCGVAVCRPGHTDVEERGTMIAPLQEERGIGPRHAQHFGDDRDRQLGRVVMQQIRALVALEVVE